VEVVRHEGEIKEPLVPWFLVNGSRLLLYLCAASLASGVVWNIGLESTRLGADDVLSVTLMLIVVGGVGSLPGAVIWLLLVARLSPETPAPYRRRVAMLLAPLTIGLPWILLFSITGEDLWGPALGLVFGILFPAGSGLVIRLREVSRSDVVDVGF
jgi:hypothetical protein